MARGRKPTPLHLKLLKGNPGKRPLNYAEPKGAGELGDAPADWTGAQKALWHEIVNAAPIGVLTKSDRLLVELTARNLAQLRASVKITSEQSSEFRRCLGELGMTPGERARMVVPQAEPDNPFRALVDRPEPPENG